MSQIICTSQELKKKKTISLFKLVLYNESWPEVDLVLPTSSPDCSDLQMWSNSCMSGFNWSLVLKNKAVICVHEMCWPAWVLVCTQIYLSVLIIFAEGFPPQIFMYKLKYHENVWDWTCRNPHLSVIMQIEFDPASQVVYRLNDMKFIGNLFVAGTPPFVLSAMTDWLVTEVLMKKTLDV